MGKQKKRKNPGVGVDFRRVKHKVGKRLPKAQNDTDVNFKSRTINLPAQSVLQDKTGAAVNFQRLTFKVPHLPPASPASPCLPYFATLQELLPNKGGPTPILPSPACLHACLQELLNQAGHYSEKCRRQSLAGLTDLFRRHPEELPRNLTDLFQQLAERITDENSGVRQALRAFLKDIVLPLLDASSLQPYMPVLMAHLCGWVEQWHTVTHMHMSSHAHAHAQYTPCSHTHAHEQSHTCTYAVHSTQSHTCT